MVLKDVFEITIGPNSSEIRMYYVVFARIDGIDSMASDSIAGAVECLRRIADELRSTADIGSFSSVYGRFLIVPARVRLSLEIAKRLIIRTAEEGVSIGIGVTVGRVEETQDLLESNVAGMAINRAARLAFLENNSGRIAIDEEVFRDAIDAGQPYDSASFSSIHSGYVKRTRLSYCWLEFPLPSVAELRPSSENDETLAQVVVYDIAQFSELPQEDLVRSVEDLRHSVKRALESAGISTAEIADRRTNDFWYAPAGDGGVVVFRSDRARQAWSFAKALLSQTEGRIPIRIGISTGIVVVVGKNLPVGKGILDADRLASIGETGLVCASERFWTKGLEERDRSDWFAASAEGGTQSLKISSKKRASEGNPQ